MRATPSITCLIAALAACGGTAAPAPGSGGSAGGAPEPLLEEEPRPTEGFVPGYRLRRMIVDAPGLRGLSGLTQDDQGVIWGVAERQRMLVRLRFEDGDGGMRVHGDPLPLLGIPDAAEAESIAWLGDGSFALGTETTRERASDEILLVRRDGDAGARVEGRVALSYGPWLLSPGDNAGIEALCGQGGDLVAASEVCGGEGARRFAPVARLDRRTGEWSRYRIWLTSRTGKLAALACRRTDDGGLEAVAVERHFGVVRLLRFDLPKGTPDGPPLDVHPVLAADLMPFLGRSVNMEGLVWLADGRLWLLSDNDSGGVRGETEALVLTPTPKAAQVPHAVR